MRLVIDTDIWVSGLLWHGPPRRLLQLAEAQVFSLYVAYPMLLELEEVLGYDRFASRLAMLNQTPAQLAAFALTLATVIDVTRVWPPIVAADPDDDLFILCAAAANADYLVTADRHLLAVGKYQGVPIIQIDDFLRRAAV